MILLCNSFLLFGSTIPQRDDGLNYWAIPVLVAAIFSMAVAYCFFSVYEIGKLSNVGL